MKLRRPAGKTAPQPVWSNLPDISGTVDIRYNLDYGVEPTDPTSASSAVVAVLQVLADRFPEPPLEVWEQADTGHWNTVRGHPAAELAANPNPDLTAALVWHYWIYATHVDGNAYLYKQRSRAGWPVCLQPLIPDMVKPKGTAQQLITHYEYTVDGQVHLLRRADVIHGRIGVDPADHRLGLGPIRKALREVWGDREASKFANALMRNAGVAPIIISPKDDEGPDEEEAKRILTEWEQRTTGENRGRAAFVSGPVEIHRIAFSPKDMDLTTLRRLPEERIAAVCGVPPVLANLGAGLEKSSGRNETRELIEAFTEGKLVPMWGGVGEIMTRDLLREFDPHPDRRMRFDLNQVRALQPDLTDLWNRVNVGVQGRWVTIEEGRQQVGLPATPVGEMVESTAASPPSRPDVER